MANATKVETWDPSKHTLVYHENTLKSKMLIGSLICVVLQFKQS